MENSEKTAEERFTLFEIIVIACFISLIFSPVGIGLMWWKSRWSRKTKIIVSGAFVLVYALIVVLFVLLNSSSQAGAGSGLPFLGMEQSSDAGGGSGGKSDQYKPSSKSVKPDGRGTKTTQTSTATESFVEKAKKSRWTYFLILVVIMFILFVIRNLKGTSAKPDDNPYVDTTLYKFPVPDDFVFPAVHYTKLALKEDEKILYATTAEQKANKGDIVVTNRRFVFVGHKENLELPLSELTAISSMSNTALLVNSGEKSYYFFVQDTQMRFVLQIVRWVYSKEYGNGE